MSKKQEQQNRDKLAHEAKLNRAERLSTKLSDLKARPQKSHEALIAELERKRAKDKLSGILDLSVNRRMVMGIDGLVVRMGKQSRRFGMLAIEYAKQGNEQAAGYFAAHAIHYMQGAFRLFETGWTAEELCNPLS